MKQWQTRVVRDHICPPRRMWTPHPDYFQNLMGTSLSKDASAIKFAWKSDHSGDISLIAEKCPITQCQRILQKIPGSGSGGRWLPKLNQFFLVYRYICGKIFAKIRSAVFTAIGSYTDGCTTYEAVCLSVRPSVLRHIPVVCRDEWSYDHAVFTDR